MMLFNTSETSSIGLPAIVADQDRCDGEKLQVMQDALGTTGHAEVRDVRIDLNGKAVILSGTVSSFYLKQVAQETVRPFAIGMKIRNQLVVASRSPR